MRALINLLAGEATEKASEIHHYKVNYTSKFKQAFSVTHHS